MRSLRFALILCCAGVAGAASALEYRALTENAVVYDAGSSKATPLFILRQGTPVETIVTLDAWVKIREAGGGLGWVERRQLAERRQVIVIADTAEVRQQATDSSPVVFAARRDVLLDVVDTPGNGWLKVRHRDGQEGFVALKSIWGL